MVKSIRLPEHLINTRSNITLIIPLSFLILLGSCKIPDKKLSWGEKKIIIEYERRYDCTVGREFDIDFVLNKKDSTKCTLGVSFNDSDYDTTAFLAAQYLINELNKEYKFKVYEYVIIYSYRTGEASENYFRSDTIQH